MSDFDEIAHTQEFVITKGQFDDELFKSRIAAFEEVINIVKYMLDKEREAYSKRRDDDFLYGSTLAMQSVFDEIKRLYESRTNDHI